MKTAKLLLLGLLLSCSSGISVDKDLIGLKLESVIQKYGNPKSQKIIYLTKDAELLEMQSNLYYLYPNIKNGDTVVLKQLFWEYPNLDKRVIWLEKKNNHWLVVDNLKWSKNIRF